MSPRDAADTLQHVPTCTSPDSRTAPQTDQMDVFSAAPDDECAARLETCLHWIR